MKRINYLPLLIFVSVALGAIKGSAQQYILPQDVFKLSAQEKVLFYPPYISTYVWPTVGYEEQPIHSWWNAFDQGVPPIPLDENAGTNDWFDINGAGSQNHAMLWIGESVLGHAFAGNISRFETAAQKAIFLLDSMDNVQGHMRHEAIGSYMDFWEAGAASMAIAGLYAPVGSTSGPALLKAARRWWSDHIAMLRKIRMPDGLYCAVGGRCKGDPQKEEWNLNPAINLQLVDPQPHNTLNTDLAALLTADGLPLQGNGAVYDVHWWDPHWVGHRWLVLRAFQTGAILRVPEDRPTPTIVQKIYKWTEPSGKIHVACPTAVGYPVRRWHASWTPGASRVWIEVADSSANAPGGKGLPYGQLPPSPQVVNIPGTAPQILGYTSFPASIPACVANGNCTNDAAVMSIAKPYRNGCSTTINPEVVVKNEGTNAITELALYYQIDNYTLFYDYAKGSVKSKRFSSSSGPGLLPDSTITLTLDASTVTPGTHTLKVWVMDVNKVTDINASNDSQTITFTVVNNGTPALPYVQDFESTNPGSIPADWTLYDADANGNWFTFGTGTNNALAFNNFSYTGAQNKSDEAVMPVVDLRGNPSIYLSFDLAHASKPSPTLYDGLELQVSTDCGNTFTSIWNKNGTALNTVPDQANLFIPASMADYQNVQVDVSAYNSANNAIFKFINWSNNGNSTLVDNVHFTNSLTTSASENNLNSSFNVFPNPTKDFVKVECFLRESSDVKYELMNSLGQILYSENFKMRSGGTFSTNIDVSKFPAGVYQVVVSHSNSISQKKLTIAK